MRGGIHHDLLPAPSAARAGFLTINSLPWSRVRLDGKVVGNTPLLKRPVAAGHHRVELLAPDGAVRRRFQVVVQRGKHRSFTFDFTK